MRRIRAAGCVVGLLALPAAAADCPAEEEVRAAVAKYHVDYNMAESYRDLWNIKDVSGFTFGPMRFAKAVEKDVGAGKMTVCPIRFDYSYFIDGEDGSHKLHPSEADLTHYFYRNEFDEWNFRSGR